MGLVMTEQGLGNGTGKAFIQMEADTDAPNRPQIDGLAMAEAFDRQAETAEDALHRQTDHGNQLADPVRQGEGIDFAEDDAGQFADAVAHARGTGGVDGQPGQFPDLRAAWRAFTGQGGGENGREHVGIGAVEQADAATHSLLILDQHPVSVGGVEAVSLKSLTGLHIPAESVGKNVVSKAIKFTFDLFSRVFSQFPSENQHHGLSLLLFAVIITCLAKGAFI